MVRKSPPESKDRDADQYPEDGDQGMDVCQFLLQQKTGYIIHSANDEEPVEGQSNPVHIVPSQQHTDADQCPDNHRSHQGQDGGEGSEDGIEQGTLHPKDKITHIGEKTLDNRHQGNANGICLDDETGLLGQYLLVLLLEGKYLPDRLLKLIIAEEHVVEDEEDHDNVDHKRVDAVSQNL